MKVRFINGEVGEFMAWVTVDRQIYAMVLRQGKFQAWEFSSIETAPETADYSKPEPDYKQAYIDLVAQTKKRLDEWNGYARNMDDKTTDYVNGALRVINEIRHWIGRHNPKGGE